LVLNMIIMLGLIINYKKYKGYAWKVNAGYTTDKVAGKLGLNAEYAYLSGDNNNADKDNKTYTSIADDYRPGIIYGGNWIDWNTTNNWNNNLQIMEIKLSNLDLTGHLKN
jgi:hypothetical protein